MSSSMLLLMILNYMAGSINKVAASASNKKILLPSGNGHCLDGSPTGFYYDGPTSLDSSLWVFFMEGGGACYTKESCTKRAKENLGSSTKWPESAKIYDRNGILSNDPVANPDFYDSHRIYIPYCTGDVHAGQRINATKETWGLYFSGHINFMQIIDFLLTDQTTGPSLKKAKQVLLSGGSAGGVGAFVNVDYLAETLSWATVKGAPMCGWFFAGYSEDHIGHSEYPPSDWPHWSEGQVENFTGSPNAVLWNFIPNEDCVRGLNLSGNLSTLCNSIHNLYPFIHSPLFVMENQYDKHQINTELLLPTDEEVTVKGREFVAYFGRAMRNSTQRQLSLKPTDGLFLPSCFDHGGGLGVGGKTIIRGMNQTALLGDWFFQRGKFDSYQIVDDCVMEHPGLPCNPTCHHLPNKLMS